MSGPGGSERTPRAGSEAGAAPARASETGAAAGAGARGGRKERPGPEGGGRDRPSPLGVALSVLGAAAGLAALATLVGGATLWIRFDALDLPADQAVALLPESLLTIVGVHALTAPVLVGLAVSLLLLGMDPLRSSDHQPRRRFWVAVALLVVGGAAAVYLGVEGLNLKYQLAMYGIAAFAILGLSLAARAAATRGRHVAYIAFAAFALCGAALALIRTAGRPMLEPVAVLLEENRGVSGFLVAETDDRVFVATLAGEGDPRDPFADAPIDRVLAVPRDEVVRSALSEPTELGTDAGGRDHAQTLLFDLRARHDPKEAPPPPRARDPVGLFAPLVHLHAQEQFWPISVGEFLSASTLYFRHERCPDWNIPLDVHRRSPVRDPAEVRPKVDPSRLGGPRPYTHPPAGAGCLDLGKPVLRATDVTRPHERDPRPAGLPRGDGFFLDVARSARRGGGRRRKIGSQVYFEQVPVYFEVHPEGRDLRRITYWLFYAFSRPPGPEAILEGFAHEGDWERVSVLVRAAGDGTWAPVSVRYHFHDENRDVPWSAVRLAAEDGQTLPTHPVAYVARNSHATYPRAGAYEQDKRVGGRVVSASDHAIACVECPQWRTWLMLRDARVQPWYGFGGAWGAAGPDSARTGPLGPSPRKSVFRPPPTLEEQRERRALETGPEAPPPRRP